MVGRSTNKVSRADDSAPSATKVRRPFYKRELEQRKTETVVEVTS